MDTVKIVPTQERICQRILGVQSDGFFEHQARFRVPIPRKGQKVFHPTQQIVVGLKILRASGNQDPSLCQGELEIQLRHDPPYDFILQTEDIAQRPVITLRPQFSAGGCIHQSSRDPYLVAGLAHTAFQYILHPQFLAHLLKRHRLALVSESGIAGDNKETGKPGEVGDQVIGDAVAEIFLLAVPAHVDEGQHGNRGLVR